MSDATPPRRQRHAKCPLVSENVHRLRERSKGVMSEDEARQDELCAQLCWAVYINDANLAAALLQQGAPRVSKNHNATYAVYRSMRYLPDADVRPYFWWYEKHEPGCDVQVWFEGAGGEALRRYERAVRLARAAAIAFIAATARRPLPNDLARYMGRLIWSTHDEDEWIK